MGNEFENGGVVKPGTVGILGNPDCGEIVIPLEKTRSMKDSKGIFVQQPLPTITLEQHVLIEITKALVSNNVNTHFESHFGSKKLVARALEIRHELMKKLTS